MVCTSIIFGSALVVTFSSLAVIRFLYSRWNWFRTARGFLLDSRRITSSVQQAEDCGDEDQSSHGGAQQSANDRAAQRGILLAAFAQPERHRNHSNDHRQCVMSTGETG